MHQYQLEISKQTQMQLDLPQITFEQEINKHQLVIEPRTRAQ